MPFLTVFMLFHAGRHSKAQVFPLLQAMEWDNVQAFDTVPGLGI